MQSTPPPQAQVGYLARCSSPTCGALVVCWYSSGSGGLGVWAGPGCERSMSTSSASACATRRWTSYKSLLLLLSQSSDGQAAPRANQTSLLQRPQQGGGQSKCTSSCLQHWAPRDKGQTWACSIATYICMYCGIETIGAIVPLAVYLYREASFLGAYMHPQVY